MRFLRINSNERVLEKPTGSANTVEDGSGIRKSWEGEGDEAFTDDVGVKLADVERGLASSKESWDWIWIWIEGGGGGGGGFGKATAIATDSGERERVPTSMDKGH